MFQKRETQWITMIYELNSRFWNAIQKPVFLFYFSSGILLIGGVGVWLPYLIDINKNPTNHIDLLNTSNLLTFTSALIGTIYVNSTIKRETDNILKQPAIFFGLLAFIFSIYGYISQPNSSSNWTIAGASIAILIYILINASDPSFDNESISSSTGYEEADPDYLSNGVSK